MNESGLVGLSDFLADLPISIWLGTTSWAIPAIQTVHILMIGLLFTTSLIVAASSWRSEGQADWILTRASLNALAGYSLAGLAASGTLLVLGEPGRALLNPLFQLKLVIVVPAAMLTFVAIKRDVRGCYVRTAALMAVAFWLAVIAAGRWIGYLDAF